MIFRGVDRIAAILVAGGTGFLLAIPTAFFAFRPAGACFAIGTRVIAAVTRLVVAPRKALGGGIGTIEAPILGVLVFVILRKFCADHERGTFSRSA